MARSGCGVSLQDIHTPSASTGRRSCRCAEPAWLLPLERAIPNKISGKMGRKDAERRNGGSENVGVGGIGREGGIEFEFELNRDFFGNSG